MYNKLQYQYINSKHRQKYGQRAKKAWTLLTLRWQPC